MRKNPDPVDQEARGRCSSASMQRTLPPAADSVEQSLRQVFGLQRFRPHQREIIDDLVAGRDAFVLMPTARCSK